MAPELSTWDAETVRQLIQLGLKQQACQIQERRLVRHIKDRTYYDQAPQSVTWVAKQTGLQQSAGWFKSCQCPSTGKISQ